jgi:hypothetical protein
VTLRSPEGNPVAGVTLQGHVDASDGSMHSVTLDPSTDDQSLAILGECHAVELVWGEGDDMQVALVEMREVDVPERRVLLSSVERRRHMRVPCSLLFRHRVLSDAEWTEMGPGIVAEPLDHLEEPPEVAGPHDETWERLNTVFSNFHGMLREISDQVQHLMALQQGQVVASKPDVTARVFNISGSGLGYENNGALEPGTKLRMSFDMAGYPYRSVVCLGEVVRAAAPDKPTPSGMSHQIFVDFTHVREEDRDRIIRFVFKMQRRHLRHRRAQDAG